MNINSLRELSNRLRKKAKQSSAVYRIAAVAYSRSGNLLGFAVNSVRLDLSASKRGSGVHAERQLMKRFGEKIGYILLSRYGNGGDMLPIHPCEICAKLAKVHGVKIISLHEFLIKKEN